MTCFSPGMLTYPALNSPFLKTERVCIDLIPITNDSFRDLAFQIKVIHTFSTPPVVLVSVLRVTF